MSEEQILTQRIDEIKDLLEINKQAVVRLEEELRVAKQAMFKHRCSKQFRGLMENDDRTHYIRHCVSGDVYLVDRDHSEFAETGLLPVTWLRHPEQYHLVLGIDVHTFLDITETECPYEIIENPKISFSIIGNGMLLVTDDNLNTALQYITNENEDEDVALALRVFFENGVWRKPVRKHFGDRMMLHAA